MVILMMLVELIVLAALAIIGIAVGVGTARAIHRVAKPTVWNTVVVLAIAVVVAFFALATTGEILRGEVRVNTFISLGIIDIAIAAISCGVAWLTHLPARYRAQRSVE